MCAVRKVLPDGNRAQRENPANRILSCGMEAGSKEREETAAAKRAVRLLLIYKGMENADMRRKVKRTMAFLMTLILAVSLLSRDQLFVAAESAQATETAAEEETQQEPSESEAAPTAEEAAEEEKLPEESTDSEADKNAPEAAPGEQILPASTPAETPEEPSSEGTDSAEVTGQAEGSSVEGTVQGTEPSGTEEPGTDDESIEAAEETEKTETEETVTEETTEAEDMEGAEEKAEKETEKPEFSYCETVDGVVVKIHAEEGILPEGTTVTIEPLSADVLENAVQSINESLEEKEEGKEVVQIIGFDICFFDPEGNELHDLDGEVTIEYSGMDISDSAKEAQVYHADEDGNITHTLTESAEVSETVEFTSDQFSPVLYAVYETKENEVMPLAYGDEGAQVFYLISPTSDPDSNATNQWGAEVTYYRRRATVNTTGATWTDNKNIFNQNSNLSQYIISWPDGTTGATWTLNKADFPGVYQAVYNTYKNELETELGITNLQLEDIEEITLIPYKISKDNGSNPDKHIDCTISVKCSKAYVARFNVQYPGETGYTNVSAENKKIVDGVADSINKYSDGESVPETKVVDGITYVFDGWYNESGQKVDESGWPYTPSSTELADGTVNFYARYVRATTNITIEKRVIGNMGDVTKQFSFSYRYGEGDNAKTGVFTLQNGKTHILEDVPIGATLTLTETNADGYTISASYGNASINIGSNGEMTFTVDGKVTEIVVTNNKEAIPDTGILLDSIPYIFILVLVIAGGLLFFLRKRRDFD